MSKSPTVPVDNYGCNTGNVSEKIHGCTKVDTPERIHVTAIKVCFNKFCAAKFVEPYPHEPWHAFCPACRAAIYAGAVNARQVFEEAEDSSVNH